jgi:SAM-dependent methyltransferase
MDQLSLLGGKLSLGELPSAKLKKVDRVARHGWLNFYAAFSENFSDSVLQCLGIKEGHVILDPFLGSGTTAVSAQKHNVSLVGWDLDPFACLLARAKVATNADSKLVATYLKTGQLADLKEFDPLASEVFDAYCLKYAARVFSRIRRKIKGRRFDLLNVICSDSAGTYDSEVVALVALCIAASNSARLVKGSNPTWYRKGVPGEIDQVSALKESAKEISLRMLSDLKSVAPRGKETIKIFNCDAQFGCGVRDNSVDFVVTSPPYLTRIDYVINHLPNLMLLSGFIRVDTSVLRMSMIGTSKVLSKLEAQSVWGETCSAVLGEIYSHPSYASQRYYYWTYVQYFSSMFKVVNTIAAKLAPWGAGVMVVQGSSYKDIEIPLSSILIEMMSAAGLDAEVVKSDPVKINMRALQSHRSTSKDARVNNTAEQIIYFKKRS